MKMRNVALALVFSSALLSSGCWCTHPWCKRWCAPRPAVVAAPPPGCCPTPGTTPLPALPAGVPPGAVNPVPGGPPPGSIPAFSPPVNGTQGFYR